MLTSFNAGGISPILVRRKCKFADKSGKCCIFHHKHRRRRAYIARVSDKNRKKANFAQTAARRSRQALIAACRKRKKGGGADALALRYAAQPQQMKPTLDPSPSAGSEYHGAAPAGKARGRQSLFSWVIHSLSTWFYPFGLAIAGMLIWGVRWAHTFRRRILAHVTLSHTQIKS